MTQAANSGWRWACLMLAAAPRLRAVLPGSTAQM
jgi:hypothetical protein